MGIIFSSFGKSIVNCKWMYITKTSLLAQLIRVKVSLGDEENIQLHGDDYMDTFSHVAKVTSIHLPYIDRYIPMVVTLDNMNVASW